jgi:ligand-binding sensor domain-containing protein/two-component sensor histidine kinase
MRKLVGSTLAHQALTVALTLASSLFFGLTAAALDPQRSLTQYGHEAWQTDSGLPQNTVHSVLQTDDGFLWLATEGGLVRFDGVQFLVYDKETTPRLRSNSVNNLFQDGSGALWISTADGLTRRRGFEFTTFTADQGLPSNSVWSVYQDRSGTLWVLTSAGLAAFDGNRFRPFPLADGLSNSSAMTETSDGRLWVSTNGGLAEIKNGGVIENAVEGLEVQALCTSSEGRVWMGTRAGLRVLQSGRVTEIGKQQGLPVSEITALLADASKRVWIGTSNGLAVYENGHIRTFGVDNGLPGERVETLYADREGNIWISTNRGLARFQNGTLQSITSQAGLSSNLVLSIHEDREGSLWLGTETGGLNVLRDQKFTTLSVANGLTEDLVRCVFQDRKGVLWVGTNGGGLNRVVDDNVSVLTTANGLPSNIVLALADDPNGDLWIGTPDGLARLHDGHVRVFTSAEGLADDFVRSLYAARDGSLWIGTRRGLSHLQRGAFTTYTRLDGLGSDLVGALLEDRHGTLWIGTLGGLSRMDHGKITTLTVRDGLASNVVTALHEDAQGILWIGTNGGGLNRLRQGVLASYPATPTGLPDNVYGILEDSAGHLWLSSNKGVFRASRQELGSFASGALHTLMPAVYGTADGMRINETSSGGHPAAWKLRNGTLAFATLKGVALIDPEHSPANALPPNVLIEQVVVDDLVLDTTKALSIPPGRGRLSIQYAGLSFVAPQKVHYRFKLEGFDRVWVDAGSRRTAYYTNIPPGSYTFRVLACNNDGVWNETGAAIQLRLQPHFYQTWIFDLLLVISLLLLAYLIYQRRLRSVESQFKAVLAERGRIAREIHDTLAQGLVGISVQLELVSRLMSASAESAKEHLDQARILVRNSLTEARSSIWDLRSQSVAGEDLATRLATMATRATASTTIKTQSKVGGAYRPLPARVESELLRIAQEAVTNAVRHANPRHISLELRFAVRQLRLTIQDDGCGFSGQPHPESAGPDGHFGLTGMSERATEIGGNLTVESSPGEGTRVCVEVALD